MKKDSKPGLIKAAVQACARWAGIPIDAGDGIAYNLGDSRNPESFGATGAMRLTAVWACVTYICEVAATLPAGLFEKTATGRRPATEHSLYRVLRRKPNASSTSAQFWSAFLASMLLRGVGYAEMQMSAGRVIGLKFLAFDRLNRTRQGDGTYRYRYTENGKAREIAAARIFAVMGFSLDGENGCSVIRYMAQVLCAARSAEQAAEGTFRRGLLPTTWFKYPKSLKSDQRNEAREMIETLSGAVNAGKPVILENEMEVGTIGINPVDAQLLESRAFSVIDICSWFRVQPWMIGRATSGQTTWGTGMEQQMTAFVSHTLAPLLIRIEQAIDAFLLMPGEGDRYYAKFSTAALLRGDSAARTTLYASASQNGWMNRNEIRGLEEMDEIEGGEIFTVQSNLIPVSQLGKAPPPAASARAALQEWLKEPSNES